ncbi:hypothetical protein Taro_044711 [Colocasia esculenta]|uniref:Uncharacterized protein n=1 Tax=Colocasia esculenta TaxID=4460 RepID=A0A843X5R5_COLES|nr:hypothetical protein [Colocasia esculenta]
MDLGYVQELQIIQSRLNYVVLIYESHNGSRVQRLWIVDGLPNHSSEDSVAGHPSQALLPTTQGASSDASASSSVAETPSWGTGQRGPFRGATERRLEPRHKWNVRVINGYMMWYCWDRTPQTDKEMLQHMTTMRKGWCGMLKSKNIAERNRQNHTHQNMTYRRGRTSIYQLKDDFERMTQMTTPSL